jgi:hypothetical protein
VLRGTLRWAVLELWEGFYVRAGRSRSSRPRQASASADAERIRALQAITCGLFIFWTVTEIVKHRKGWGMNPRQAGGIIAAP